MKKIVLFLVMPLFGVVVMASEMYQYTSLDGAQTIEISYNKYGNGDTGTGETSYEWQATNTNIITDAVEVFFGDNEEGFNSWAFQKGQQFALEIEGVANATGKLKTGIVDEQEGANWWFQNSIFGSPSLSVVAGEQFNARIVYTITALASIEYSISKDIPGLNLLFEMADYDAATEFNNGIVPSEDLSNVKNVEFDFTTFKFSYLGDLNQYTKPYILQSNGESVYPETGYAYQTTFSLAYDNAATTSDFFNYNISGYSVQDIDSLYIALWDASGMATRPYATSLCTDDVSGMTMIATQIKSNEPFQLQGSLPIVRNSNGTENNYNVLLYALSANNELQIILDLNRADEFSIGEEKYGETPEELQYAVVDGIRYGYVADTAFVTEANNETSYMGDMDIPSQITIGGRDYMVTAIDNEAFNYSQITSVIVPNTITRLGSYAFGHCYELTSVILSEGLLSIGYDAFAECSVLSAINLPNTLQSIEAGAFAHCHKLSSIVIPENVNSISSGEIFNDCIELSSIEVDPNNTKYDSRDNCNAIIETETNTLIAGCKSTIIPETISKIGEYAFYGCIKDKITIPQGVVSIEKGAFYQCDSLILVDLPESLISIGPSAFSNCINLPYIYIPQNVTFIGNNAFLQCFNLKAITIPKSVTTIEYDVFHLCTSLYHIEVENGNMVFDSRDNCNAIIATATNSLIAGCSSTIIPETVTSIAFGALMDYKGLSIKIPNGVQSIGDRAFLGSKITTISIPSNVKTLGYNVFSSCSELRQIFCSATVPPTVNYYNIEHENLNPSLIVPCESLEAYRSHEYWGQFANIECRTLKLKDIESISKTDEEALPTINLLEYFTKAEDEEITFTVSSSDNQIIYPVLRGNSLSFLPYGTGEVTITVTAMVDDFSAETSFTITITPMQSQQEIPCALSISSEITNATCSSVANGKIELSVSGGTEPYQYKWTTGRTSSGIYNVGSGTYSVLVMDDNGCTAMETFSVNEPSALAIFETPTNPSCGESNGSIDVMTFGGIEPYSYAWNGTTQTTNVVENLSTGNYSVTVTDGNGCTATKTISLSEQNAPSVTLQSVTASKCNEAQGSISVEVSGGTYPYTYEWSDSSEVANALNRPKMFAGDYTLTVTDGNNCRATLAVTVPPIPFKQPEIALVSYGKQSKHNLIVWKKEQTNEIDKYLIYRETEQNGEYEQIGSQNYNEISVFVDETTNPRTNPNPYRYRISAANKCLESPLSHESKTINLQWKRDENNAIHLWWDAYEGVEYVKFTVYRLTRGGQFLVSEVPANKFRYIAENPEPETMGYFIAVDLIEEIDVTQAMKSESGPFVIVVSNIAELENFVDAIDGIPENQAIVYAKGKNIVINSTEQANVVVFDIAGQLVAQQNAVQSTMIPVKTAGVYVVIVGDKAYKVVVE